MKYSIRFKLKNQKAKESLLYVTISYGHKDVNDRPVQLKMSTGYSIPILSFSPESGVKSSCPNQELKILLGKFKRDTEDKIYKISMEEKLSDLSPNQLRYILSGDEESDRPKTLIQFIDQYVKQQEERNIKKFADATLQAFRALKVRLSDSKWDWRLKDINTKYVADYLDYISPRFKANSLWKEHKMLRKFCRLAELKNVKWSDESLQFSDEITTAIYLNFDQLKKLLDYDFGDKMYLDRVRDGFCFQAFTGMRFIDFKKKCTFIEEGGTEFIYLKPQKTIKHNTEVYIPVLPPLKAILEKYQYNLPNDISNVNYNAYLKEIGAAVFENEKIVTCYYTKNGKEQTEKKAFGAMLCSHSGRRSFASNFYELGIPIRFLMTILGMKKESTFYKYIRQEKQRQAKEVLKAVMSSSVFQSYFSVESNTDKVHSLRTA